MAIKVGVASGTWGIGPETVPGQVAWDTFLDESAEAGYEWIEAGHYGYLPTDPDFLRAELAKRGTQVVATTVMNGHLDRAEDWPATEADVLRSGELGASLGAKHMVLIDDLYPVGPGTPVSEANLDGDSWRRLIDTTHRVADIALERFGVPIAFHSHAQTHVETQEQLEAFLRDTDPGRVSLCLDTGHYAYSGGDPVEFMRRHHTRVSYMHFKDVDGAVLERVRSEGVPLQRANEMGVFCQIGTGVIDYVGLGKVLHETGYDGWVLVEQDTTSPPPCPPLPLARRAREYLREVGIG